MGHVEVAHVSHVLPDGRTLLDDASFKIGEGITAALVGPNGAGKTTLLRLIAGDAQPQSGVITATGTLGVMRQFIGGPATAGLTVRDLLLSVAPQRVRDAAGQLDDAELAMMERDDEPAQLGYAKALNDYAEAGGYDAEVHWDECCVAALGTPYDLSRWRAVSTLSGGQQKRLVLESLLRGAQGTLLLDEPDNYLDVGGKRWLENQLATTTKTVLLVSHDRELLNACAQRIVTVEDGKTWVHGGGFATYDQARRDRIERLEELRRRWDEEQAKLRDLVRMYRQKASYNSDMASRLQAAVTRLEKFEAAGPPELPPREQHIKVRLKGGRTGRRAVMCEGLAVAGTTRPFDAEIWYGDRIAILGANGSGKSSFLRLLAGEPLAHEGTWKLGARVVPGMFAQTHARPDLEGRAPAEILMTEHALLINEAMAALARYELHKCARQPFGTLSGGQQARLQILLLELGGATLLLLDEPTDNLDLPSADALQAGLEAYQGTVLAVTHDRWFARSLDSCLVFGSDGAVRASAEPVWDLSEFSERTRCDPPDGRTTSDTPGAIHPVIGGTRRGNPRPRARSRVSSHFVTEAPAFSVVADVAIIKGETPAADRTWLSFPDGTAHRAAVHVIHDLPHLVVESVFGLPDGLWGTLAAGGFAPANRALTRRRSHIRLVTDAPFDDLAAGTWPAHKVAKAAVNAVLNRWRDGPDTPAGVRARLRGNGRDAAMLAGRLDDDSIRLAAAGVRRLYRDWAALPTGDALRLTWPLHDSWLRLVSP